MQLNNSKLFSNLKERFHHSSKNVGFIEGSDIRILQASLYLYKINVVNKIYFFCSMQESIKVAQIENLDISELLEKSTWVEQFGQCATELSAKYLNEKIVDIVLGGVKFTTSEIVKTGIKKVKLAPGIKTVSGAFFMEKASSDLLLYADCGVTPEPTIDQLVDIATESLKTWCEIQHTVEPVVAFLSFSTKGSAVHPSVSKIKDAYQIFKSKNPKVICEGEIQFDAAIDLDVQLKKIPINNLQKTANIFIFPDLNSGNIAYKVTQRLAKYNAYGPILQGLNLPFSDLSRGANVEDIVMSSLINLARSC